MSRNALLMNKPRALWEHLKRHGKNCFQLSQTQHIWCQSDGERGALFNSLFENRQCWGLKESLQAVRASVLGCSSSMGWVSCCELHRWNHWGSADFGSCLKIHHFQEESNVWGQSERKTLQGTASTAGTCGVSVIGGVCECLQMKEHLNGEEGWVLF